MSEKEGRDDENRKVGRDDGRGTGIEASRAVDTLSPRHSVPHGRERDAGQKEKNKPGEAFGYHKCQNRIADSLFDGKDTDADILKQN